VARRSNYEKLLSVAASELREALRLIPAGDEWNGTRLRGRLAEALRRQGKSDDGDATGPT
jgi:hypothetical protein